MISRPLFVQRGLRVGAGMAIAAAMLASGAAAAPRAEAAPAVVNPNDRASVQAAYLRQWLAPSGVDSGWTGSSAACRPGSISAAAQSATLTSINFARSLVGLTPTRFTDEFSGQTQQTALMMDANAALSHTPPASWKCYSDDGAAGARTSNIALGAADVEAIGLYLGEPGSTNTAVGHRRWVLDPAALVMAHGSTDAADALKVFDLGDQPTQYANPAWVSWPSSGYFPIELEPDGRWSLSGQFGQDWDFSAASVTVQDSTGKSLPVTLHPQANGYGADTLSWEVSGLPQHGGLGAPVFGSGERDYTVAVTGIVGPAGATSTTYRVRLFDPEAKSAPKLLRATRLHGTAAVGKKLRAVAAKWSPIGPKATYRWYRGTQRITKATGATYRLRAADRGARISVTVSIAATTRFKAAHSTAVLAHRVR